MNKTNTANKIGICLNFGNCNKANTKEQIQINIGDDFKCPECDGELVEIKKEGSPKGIIAAAIAVLIIAGGATAFFLLQGDKTTPILPEPIEEPVEISVEDPTEQKDTLVIANVEEIAEKIIAQPKEASQDADRSKTGTVSITGGTYTGALKNGKPHGTGTLTYNSRTLIRESKGKSTYAEAGEYITGKFDNGKLEHGELYGRDGIQKEAIRIGKQ